MTSSFSEAEIESLSEDYLVLMATSRHDNDVDARLAIFELHRRHADFLKKRLKEIFPENIEMVFEPEDLVWDLFWKLYDSESISYDTPNCTSEVEHRKNFRKWAFVALKHAFVDEIRHLPRSPFVEENEDEDGGDEQLLERTDDSIESMDVEQEEEPIRVAQNIALVTSVLDSLSEEDRTVARMIWAVKNRSYEKTPSDVLQGLATALNMTTDGIRQKEYRMREKIRKKLDGQIQYK